MDIEEVARQIVDAAIKVHRARWGRGCWSQRTKSVWPMNCASVACESNVKCCNPSSTKM